MWKKCYSGLFFLIGMLPLPWFLHRHPVGIRFRPHPHQRLVRRQGGSAARQEAINDITYHLGIAFDTTLVALLGAMLVGFIVHKTRVTELAMIKDFALFLDKGTRRRIPLNLQAKRRRVEGPKPALLPRPADLCFWGNALLFTIMIAEKESLSFEVNSESSMDPPSPFSWRLNSTTWKRAWSGRSPTKILITPQKGVRRGASSFHGTLLSRERLQDLPPRHILGRHGGEILPLESDQAQTNQIHGKQDLLWPRKR